MYNLNVTATIIWWLDVFCLVLVWVQSWVRQSGTAAVLDITWQLG